MGSTFLERIPRCVATKVEVEYFAPSPSSSFYASDFPSFSSLFLLPFFFVVVLVLVVVVVVVVVVVPRGSTRSLSQLLALLLQPLLAVVRCFLRLRFPFCLHARVREAERNEATRFVSTYNSVRPFGRTRRRRKSCCDRYRAHVLS